jgi:salicylate 5-hydroxylase large subunit
VAKFQPDYVLADPSLIAPRKEFADDVTLAMQTLFPNLIIQAQSNTLAMRHVIPRGTGQFELAWTFFGYADDDAELATLRLRQANLMGAAGYVSVDDTEMMDCSHAGILSAAPDGAAVFELGGRDTEPTDHLVTENAIRGFYQHYRRVMGLG